MTRTKKSAMLHLPTIRFCANMAELVDATDLKSVGNFSRAGSIPAFRTILKNILFGVFFCMKRVEALSVWGFMPIRSQASAQRIPIGQSQT